jgi:translocation and assembly module TamB
VASVSFRSLTADVAAPRAGEWRVAARSGADEEPGVAVSGTVTRADSGAAAGAVWSVALDSLDVRARGTGLRLAAPARVRAGPAGVFVDTLELTGRRGAHLRAAAALRADGPVDAFLSADEVPLAALALLAGRTDSTTLARLPATLTAEARLGGTRAAPVASIEGALHGAPRPDSAAREAPLLDSVHVRGTYDEDRAAAALGIFAAGRRLLALEAEVPVRASLAPGSVAVLDTVLDAPLAGRLVVDSVALGDVRRSFPTLPGMAGTVRARVALSGTARHPRLDGELRVRDGALDAEALGVALDSVQVEVALLGDTLVLRRASVRGTGDAHGPGRATLGGWVALADPSDPTFDLRLRAARMPVVALDRRAELEVDADLRLAGARHGATLGGSATARRGVVRLPELGSHDVVGDADTAFVRLVDSLTNRKEDRGRRAAANGLLDRLTIRDLELRAGDDVWLRSSEANLSIGGAVRVTRVPPRGGDTARVEVSGELRAVRGTYALDVGPLRRTFTLESGVLRFDGADALDPRLDVSAVHVLPPDPSLARTREVRVRARLRGTLQHPELTLDDAAGVAGATGTALTQEELLGYLVTGQPSFRVGQGEASNALARSELTSRVTGEVERRLGGGGLFDVVTITPGAVGEDDAASLWEQTAEALRRSRVGVGKRIDDRTFLSVDAGGCALAGAAAQGSLAESLGLGLDYRARPDLTFSLRSEPPTSATLCGGSLPHGYIPAPRQWGLEAVKRWRF